MVQLKLILYSNVITLSGYYETFFTLGQGCPENRNHLGLDPTSRSRRVEEQHAVDVGAQRCPEGPGPLKEAGFRLMTLTTRRHDGGTP
jgi:hypothetical protein